MSGSSCLKLFPELLLCLTFHSHVCLYVVSCVCRNVITTVQKFTAKKWASLVGTQVIDRNAKKYLKRGDIVFEYDFDKYADKNNPGVGPALGTIIDVNRNDAAIKWADAADVEELEDMRFKDIRLSPGFDEQVELEHGTYELAQLCIRGCMVHVTKAVGKKSKAKAVPEAVAKTSTKQAVPAPSTPTPSRWRDRRTPVNSPAQASLDASPPKASLDASPPMAPVDHAWIRTRAKSLTAKQIKTVQEMKNSCTDWDVEEYEVYSTRVIREYVALQRSKLHLNKQKVLKAAVARVNTQIRPKGRLPPYDGNKDEAVKALLPVVIKVNTVLNRCLCCTLTVHIFFV